MSKLKLFLLSITLLCFVAISFAQDLDYNNPQQYEIGGIRVEGTEHLDKKVLVSLSGMRVGDIITIPGQEISSAVKNLWEQHLFTDVSIEIERVLGETVFLIINLTELPRLSKYSITGVKNTEIQQLRKKINLKSGRIFTESDKLNVIQRIRAYYIEKGFYNATAEITVSDDNVIQNSIVVDIVIDKGTKVKIDQIQVFCLT